MLLGLLRKKYGIINYRNIALFRSRAGTPWPSKSFSVDFAISAADDTLDAAFDIGHAIYSGPRLDCLRQYASALS